MRITKEQVENALDTMNGVKVERVEEGKLDCLVKTKKSNTERGKYGKITKILT